jgi:hypothetical protein
MANAILVAIFEEQKRVNAINEGRWPEDYEHFDAEAIDNAIAVALRPKRKPVARRGGKG